MQDISKIVENVISEINNAPVSLKKKHTPLEKMTLASAKELIEAVEKKAAEMGVKAVVAVSSAEGNPMAVECMDGAYIASYDIAVNKAFTSVSLKMATSKLAILAAPGGSLYGIQHTNGGKIVIFGGGETLESGGKILGGLGVSGGTAEEDTYLGEYGKKYFTDNLA